MKARKTFSPLRRLSLVGLGLLLASAQPAALAQSESTGTIRFVLPFGPGGSTDTLLRLLADGVSGILNAPVVVENKPGASGFIAAQYVARSAPDGRTVFFGSASTLVNNIGMFKQLPYDPVKDFTPVGLIGKQSLVMFARNDAPFKTMKEMVAYAKSNPGVINRGSPGAGTLNNLVSLQMEKQYGFTTTAIPHTGDVQSVTAMMGGNLDISLGGGPTVMSYISSGKLRGLAVMGESRLKALPDVPTIDEAGFEDSHAVAWYALVVPSATPEDRVVKLNAAINEVMARPDVANRIRELGIEPATSTPQEAAQLIDAERARWLPIIRESGIQPQ